LATYDFERARDTLHLCGTLPALAHLLCPHQHETADKTLRRLAGFALLHIGLALSACSPGQGHPASVGPTEAVTALSTGPLRDASGTLYGDADRVTCDFTIANGPLELPARLCVDGGGTIEGEAFHSPPRTPVPSQPSLPSSGAIEAPLQEQGGVQSVPVTINDTLTLDFMVDSGAAVVSIPADVVQVLARIGTIATEDFLGSKTYRLADGSTVPSQTFRIRSLKVGDITLQNVIGSVVPGKGSLLLGQSFLGRFRSWSIDNSRRMLILDNRW
jgi:clan AA aspartic protease (TIGR02281 family)